MNRDGIVVVDTHVLVRVAKLGGLVEELWVLVVTDAGFAKILMVAAGEGGGGGSENLMGILTFLFILVY